MLKLRKLTKSRLIGAVTIGLAAAVVLFSLLASQTFEDWGLKSWDLRARVLKDPAKADRNIKLIVVDQHSLEQIHKLYGFSWPIPRGFYQAVLKYLQRANARGVAFDIIFSEPSLYGEEDDKTFIDGIAEGLPVVNAIATSSTPPEEQGAFVSLAERQKSRDLPRARNGQTYSSVTLPIERIAAASAELGNVTATSDKDGVIRRYALASSLQKIPVLGLANALYYAVSGKQQYSSQFARTGGHATPVLRFHGGAGTYPTYSLSDIIQSWAAIEEGQPPLVALKDFDSSLVFVGVWAPGLMDQRITPLDPQGRGVDVHATALDNLSHNDFITRASAKTSFAVMAPLILLMIAAILYSRNALQQLLGASTGLVAILGVAIYFAQRGLWIDLFAPMIVAAAASAVTIAYQYAAEGRRRAYLRRAFQHYVSPSVIDKMILAESEIKLGGDRRELTLFFSDIAGFTSISEQLPPEKVGELLNDYLSILTEVIQNRNGTVDKFVGDAVVAFWNAPLNEANHAQLAVEAAMECQRRLNQKANEFITRFGFAPETRIGIHTGSVTVGNFGGADRFSYTVLGDAANLASRLEGLNKFFGTKILTSLATRERCNNSLTFRRLGRAVVVGRNEPVEIFEPIIDMDRWPLMRVESFETGLNQIAANNLVGAKQSFSLIVDSISPPDSSALLYLDLIRRCERGELAISEISVIRIGEK